MNASEDRGDSLVVGPSKRQSDWRDFFSASRWEPTQFAALVEVDEIGAAFFEIETYINGLYRGVQQSLALARQLDLPVDPDRVEEARLKARWLVANSEPYREALGPLQRDLALGLMRWMRRASALSVVIGAGVTMDAGGPSWSELVRRLLLLVTERGREIWEMRPTPESTPEQTEVRRVVTGVEHLAPAVETRARELLARISSGEADTEMLMEGAQICYDFLDQHLFTALTQILYEGQRRPGAIHQAIAELSTPILVPDRGGWFPGWDAIITYNFDDLMGEALDEAGLARASYAMRGDQVAGDPNELAIQRGQGGLHQSIYHLHGYTPRKLFLITHVRYVFSTSQYKETYGGSHVGIAGEVFDRWLANPVHHSLYVGCSFRDETMNALLRDAARTWPGRYHYALLKWPGDGPLVQVSPEEIAFESAEYALMGVRPVWFDDFGEIPQLIRRLA